MRRVLPLVVLLLFAPRPARPGDAGPADPRLERARALRDEWEARAAERIYLEILADRPEDFAATLGLGKVAAALGEGARAEATFFRAARLSPERPEPWCELGALSVWLDRHDEAGERYRRALSLAPEDAESLAGLARVAVEREDFPEADRLLDAAEARAPDGIPVLGARSEYCYRRGDMGGAASCLRRILAIEPLNVLALRRFSNGFVEPDRPPWRPRAVAPEYAAKAAAAAALYRGGDFEDAEAALARLDAPGAPDARPAFFRGLIALRRGETRAAEAHLRRALAVEPDHPLVANAFAVARILKLARQRSEYGGGPDGIDRISPLAAGLRGPEVPGIRHLVPGYERILPAERAVVDHAVRPFAARLPVLRAEGVTHEILGLDEGICDAPERRPLVTRRTADGRWYGGLRGVGGRHAATGIESILEAAELRYDTFAHEFAHQVHVHGLTAEEKQRILDLYRAAKERKGCLDYYAQTNEREYFAQGYEAFVSVVKSPWHQALRRHTRAELRARDPALFDLLLALTGTEDPDPALRPLADRILAFYAWSGDATALAEARALLAPFLPAPPDSPR